MASTNTPNLLTAGPLLCLAGPTASGKTAAALAIAQAFAEQRAARVRSRSSASTRRWSTVAMDIGTAKPTVG